MNQEQVLELAWEVGAGEPESLYGRTDYVVMTKHELERFAALVAAAEREACAKVCEGLSGRSYEFDMGRLHSAAAIRERLKK